MKIAVTGARGMVGSRLVELLKEKYECLPLSSQEIDIRDKNSIYSFFLDKKIDIILHLAAKTDVDGSELEKELGEESEAWKINVSGTRNIAEYCNENSVKLIYVSTDFVFNGEKKKGEFYTEEDIPDPINFYGKTKFEGEKAVQNSGSNYTILRIGYPYRKEFAQKKDFVRAIIDRLNRNLPINAVSDHFMCPTFIDDIADCVDVLIRENGSGIYHCVGGSLISPYEAALVIADEFGFEKSLINPTTRAEYFANKARRPFNLYLKNVRIEAIGIKTKTFQEGLSELKR